MKITFVSYIYPYPNRGFNPGIERVIGELSHALVNKGHQVNVITTYRNNGTLSEEIDDGVHIYRINDLRNIFGKYGSIFSLDLLSINYFINKHMRIIENSDIIHSFSPLIVDIPNVPLVSHFHHDEKIRKTIEYFYLPTSQYLWDKTYKKSNAIISVSKYSALYLKKYDQKINRVKVVPNGVDMNKFYPMIDIKELKDRFDGKTILLYVGPITNRKGLKYLIEAMPEILVHKRNTVLIMVGGGDSVFLQNLSKNLGVQNIVFFEGFVPEEKLPMYYNACDLFVFPSLQEGFGMALIEAMACGKTVVASNNTAIPEVVGDAGILVESKNSIALGKAIISLLDDAEKKKNLEQKAICRVKENFTWDIASEKLLDIYRTCINK